MPNELNRSNQGVSSLFKKQYYKNNQWQNKQSNKRCLKKKKYVYGLLPIGKRNIIILK